MALQVLIGPEIQAGQALSDPLDCRAGSIVRLTMSEFWTDAPLTFQISTDGEGYNDLVHMDGTDVMIPIVVPGSAVVVAPLNDYLKAVAFLKVRSGSRKSPVVQPERRQFSVAIEVADGEAPPARASGRR